jgi:TonB family protein
MAKMSIPAKGQAQLSEVKGRVPVLCLANHLQAMNATVRSILTLVAFAASRATPALSSEPPSDSAAPGIVETREPMFPPGLQASGFSYGEADVAIKVDAAGKLGDVLVTAYTRRQFADEAVRAIKTWTFEPARSQGGPVGWVRNLRISFRVDGARIVIDNPEHPAGKLSILVNPDDHFDYRPCALRDLDRIPRPRHVVEPTGFQARASGRPVVIEFYIDEEGRVRVPAVSEGDDAAFANAALAAVSQWRFDPPTRAGTPVLVRASQVFRVAPPDAQKGGGP